LSVVIPTLNAAATLPLALAALAGASCEIVIADGGSVDQTLTIAEAHGARVAAAQPGRGPQLAAGARAARGDWLLFLHADTRLGVGWAQAVAAFVRDPANGRKAAAFRYAVDLDGAMARGLEAAVAWRSRLGLPYGDQGLLIGRALYDDLGGFPDLPIMEDVALVRRIGRARLTILDPPALTSGIRYHRAGIAARGARNLLCLGLYFLGVPPRLLARLYG
jgi:rSAM/selenodomain-associated transferase 2